MPLSEEREQPRERESTNRSRAIPGYQRTSCVLQRIHGIKATVPTHPLLSDVVERIADWDVPDGEVARKLAPKTAPSTAPFVVVQYRTPFESDRHQGYVHVACVVRSGAPTLRPNGPVGAVIVRLRPETANRLMGTRMQEFLDEKIDLCNLFKMGELAQLEDALRRAPDSATRFVAIESFLLQNLRETRPLPVACRAAQILRRNPALSIRRLATQLEVSERHLSRVFRAMYGSGPKEFARFTRLERVVAMRQAGRPWVDIAHACGFADQAHMIRDFEAISGESPQQFFGASQSVPCREADAATNEFRIDRLAEQVIYESFG
jgi:AraC-like DNA-binding protein